LRAWHPTIPEIEMLGVVADFSEGLPLHDILDSRPVTFFYPGSSIGNFTHRAGAALHRRHPRALRTAAGQRAADRRRRQEELLGLDAAYDDALGVTAAFNLNALLHLNSRFGFDFALDGYRHVGFYNEAKGASRCTWNPCGSSR
jgi:uncharacterized SAM-dependent methyltransferase